MSDDPALTPGPRRQPEGAKGGPVHVQEGPPLRVPGKPGRDPSWAGGQPDFRRARMALFSVEAAIGDHCAAVDTKCEVCARTQQLRAALESADDN